MEKKIPTIGCGRKLPVLPVPMQQVRMAEASRPSPLPGPRHRRRAPNRMRLPGIYSLILATTKVRKDRLPKRARPKKKLGTCSTAEFHSSLGGTHHFPIWQLVSVCEFWGGTTGRIISEFTQIHIVVFIFSVLLH